MLSVLPPTFERVLQQRGFKFFLPLPQGGKTRNIAAIQLVCSNVAKQVAQPRRRQHEANLRRFSS